MKVRVAVKQLKSSPEVGGVSIEDQNSVVNNCICRGHAKGSAAMKLSFGIWRFNLPGNPIEARKSRKDSGIIYTTNY